MTKKSLRRADRYKYQRTKAFGRLDCSWQIWMWRTRLAKMGIRPEAMRGKGVFELRDMWDRATGSQDD